MVLTLVAAAAGGTGTGIGVTSLGWLVGSKWSSKKKEAGPADASPVVQHDGTHAFVRVDGKKVLVDLRGGETIVEESNGVRKCTMKLQFNMGAVEAESGQKPHQRVSKGLGCLCSRVCRPGFRSLGRHSSISKPASPLPPATQLPCGEAAVAGHQDCVYEERSMPKCMFVLARVDSSGKVCPWVTGFRIGNDKLVSVGHELAWNNATSTCTAMRSSPVHG